ncbi:hypothetical protein PACTADRAFT_49870 [Pachysolen tannophilus NRRL Y-2460]|uniref:Protein kinase domain-containing protein n=1 Tax=Pachysolen tannophilus NRRL Y-2460 TaxID=669874 RepID=A0A1E4TTR6_PACTA|nr:hypothetical protein PACTADRAFT_49870 [Pachysolen tannophilus NRRL Y-2460]
MSSNVWKDYHYEQGDIWPSVESIRKVNIDERIHFKCKYVVLAETLGSGTYSVVKEGVHKDSGLHYAIKVIKKNLMYGRESLIQNEITILKKISKFNHKNILSLNDFFETDDELYLVTDLATGGDLFDKISSNGSYFEQDAINIIKSLCDAVQFLHHHNIIHRDLKSENLVFKTTSIKSEILITDFGLATFYNKQKDKLNLICGTLSHIAPEILIHKYPIPSSLSKEQIDIYLEEKITGYSYPVDIWSLGVLTYFVLCGYMPFDCETDDETREAIMTGDYYFEPKEYWENISDNAKDFISKCFNLNQNQRITIDELVNHKFLIEKSTSHVDLLQSFKSNYSLHKLGYSPRQSPINTPRNLSPEQSIKNIGDYFKKSNMNPSSSISLNMLNKSLTKLQQKRNNQDIIESPTFAHYATKRNHNHTSHQTYMEKARHAAAEYEARMNGCLSEEPEIANIDNLILKSEHVSAASSVVSIVSNREFNSFLREAPRVDHQTSYSQTKTSGKPQFYI